MISEQQFQQLIYVLDRLAKAIETVGGGVGVGGGVPGTPGGGAKPGKETKPEMQKDSVLSPLRSLNPGDLAKDVVSGLSGTIQAGFSALGREIAAPIHQALSGIGKDIASGMQAQVTAALEPREQIREVMGRAAEAGKPIPEDEARKMFDLFKRQSRMRAEGISRGKDIADEALPDDFITKMGGGAFYSVLEQFLGFKSGAAEYERELWKIQQMRDAQKQLFDNRKTQGE